MPLLPLFSVAISWNVPDMGWTPSWQVELISHYRVRYILAGMWLLWQAHACTLQMHHMLIDASEKGKEPFLELEPLGSLVRIFRKAKSIFSGVYSVRIYTPNLSRKRWGSFALSMWN